MIKFINRLDNYSVISNLLHMDLFLVKFISYHKNFFDEKITIGFASKINY